MTTIHQSISVALGISVLSGCFVPNIICYEKTYRLKGTMDVSAPLNQDLLPSQTPLSCTSAANGSDTELEGVVSITEQEFTGELEITDQDDLQLLDEMMTAIEAGEGSMKSAQHQSYYTSVIDTMVDQMQAGCVEYLTESYLNCTGPSAEGVCSAYLANPTRARYLDLDQGEGYVRPVSVNSGLDSQGPHGSCYYYHNPPMAESDTEDATGDEGSSSTSGGASPKTDGDDGTSGADESSGGEGAVAPFGPLDELVHCNRARTDCTYERRLLDNVLAASGVVEADGALLRLLAPGDSGYPGVRLEGFDRDEPTTELAAAAGLADGDIIQSVDGTRVVDQDTLSAIVERLLIEPAATLVYVRDGRTREVRIEPR